MRAFRVTGLSLLSLLLASCGAGKGRSYSAESQALCNQGPMVSGMDVSHHQGTIDFNQVRNAGFSFAIAKVSEGTGFADPNFATYWQEMKAAGVSRGAYHFFHPSEDGTAQADYFLSLVALEPGDLPPMLDWEVDDCPSYGNGTCPSSDATTTGCLSVAAQVQAAQDFINEIQAKTGLTTVIYTYTDFWNCMNNPDQFSAYPLWQASYPSTSSTTSSAPPTGECPNVLAPWTNWTVWQWSAFGSVTGIQSGPIDFDVFNGTMADFQAFAIPGAKVDGGSPVDAGTPEDAGTHVDAGTPEDAGTHVDAGVREDAGTHEDAGTRADAGAIDDAGITVVADGGGTSIDAGVSVSADAGAASLPAAASGCSATSSSLMSLLICLLLVTRRRTAQT